MSFCGVSTEFRRFEFASPFRTCHLPSQDCSTEELVLSLDCKYECTEACDEGLAVEARASNKTEVQAFRRPFRRRPFRLCHCHCTAWDLGLSDLETCDC